MGPCAENRPDVVVIEGLKMPRANRAADENAKYCSLFFRPWTLLPGTLRIPNLALLGMPHGKLVEVYATSGITSIPDQVQGLSTFVAWDATWDEYVHGNVVSEAAAMLIRSFLLKTIAATGTSMELDRSDDEENEPHDPDIPAVRLEAAQFQQLLSPYHDVAESDNEGAELDSAGKKLQKKQKKKIFQDEYRRSIDIARTVWSTDSQHRETGERTNVGGLFKLPVARAVSF